MKNEMSLDGYGVMEIGEMEKRNIVGGNPFFMWLALGLAYDIISNPKAHINAYNRGYNAQF